MSRTKRNSSAYKRQSVESGDSGLYNDHELDWFKFENKVRKMMGETMEPIMKIITKLNYQVEDNKCKNFIV